jgi:integrase
LDTATEIKTVSGEERSRDDGSKTETALAVFEGKSITRGVSKQVVDHRIRVLEWLTHMGADLFMPISVWHVIEEAKQKHRNMPWSQATKKVAANCYIQFCKMVGLGISDDLNFKKWHRTIQKLPFIPLDQEIEQLMGGCNRKTGAFLQLLRETGLRSGEAWRLTWADLNSQTLTVTMNTPEKGSLPRQFVVSSKLVTMLNMLPKNNERIFELKSGDMVRQLHSFRVNFRKQRNRVSAKLGNPRIKSITFHTLRHYYATMLYHKTKDIVFTQQKLGHKKIENTMIYTHLVEFQNEEYHSTVAATQSEKLELINSGWDFIVQDRTDGLMYFRKRK